MAREHPGPIPHSVAFGSQGPHVVFGILMHGDEPGPLPAALVTMGWLSAHPGPLPFRVTFFVGNGPAALLGNRYGEADLNRQFGATPTTAWEFHRAQEIQGLLASSDIFIDFHQTQAPTPHPFYVLGHHKPTWDWANTLALAPVAVVPSAPRPRATSHPSATTGAQWCRRQGIPALLVEVGQRGLSEATTQGVATMMASTLHTLALNSLNPAGAPWGAPLLRRTIAHTILLDDPGDRLREGWINFAPVEMGQVLGERARGAPIVSPVRGQILFPIYPPRSQEGRVTGGLPRRLAVILNIENPIHENH